MGFETTKKKTFDDLKTPKYENRIFFNSKTHTIKKTLKCHILAYSSVRQICDEFLSSISNDFLCTKLWEKKVDTVQALARLADEYVLHRKTEATIKFQSRPQTQLAPSYQNNALRQQDTKPENTVKEQLCIR